MRDLTSSLGKQPDVHVDVWGRASVQGKGELRTRIFITNLQYIATIAITQGLNSAIVDNVVNRPPRLHCKAETTTR